MLSDKDTLRALCHCDTIKTKYPVRFMQVMPDPFFVDNVQIRVGRGQFVRLHYTDARAYALNALRAERKLRKSKLSA